MKILLSMLLGMCLIAITPYILRDRQGAPYLEQHINMLLNYPAQYEAWQRITERFIPQQYFRDESSMPEDTAPVTVHTWRDTKGVTHFTEPGRESIPVSTKIKTLTIKAEHKYISQMPDQRTTYLFAATLWLLVTSLCYGMLSVFSRLHSQRVHLEQARFSRADNMQAINEQKAAEKARKAAE